MHKNFTKKHSLPLIPLKGLVVFPYMILHFDVGRPRSVKALEEAMVSNQLIFLAAQMDDYVENPSYEDLYNIGTIAKVKQLLKLPGDNIRVLVEGISRASLASFISTEPFIIGEVREYVPETTSEHDIELEALMRSSQEVFNEYFQLNNKFPPETIASIVSIEDPGQLSDVIAANLMLDVADKQSILECLDTKMRLERLIFVLNKEIEILELERSIKSKVKSQIDEHQKEYFLREQLKVIQNELGDRDEIDLEIEAYRKKIDAANLSEEVIQKLDKELERLSKMPSGMAEAAVIRTYVDWVLDLPWSVSTKESGSLKKAEDILSKEHYGLEKVKERILEYLAVRKMTNAMQSPILCLVGPPGVGKTSIARSLAHALNRNYVRMSLGGVRDEAEIRGHRRTYVGSMPGRIISALKLAKSNNALVLLDEIDKMSHDFRGDPASAMLEVLDSEQNNAFRDHYLELPFDLSKILFVTTANSLDPIPRPLLDRMEIIEVSSYTEEEKLNIARRHLLPKQMYNHGLTKTALKISEPVLRDIINYYTREAGVRNLEREISSICRKTAKYLVTKSKASLVLSPTVLEEFLGARRYRYDKAQEQPITGVATGLAWTSVGGDTLSIEANVMEGTGKIELTGHLGDVMKESARAAISYIRSKADSLKIYKDFYKNADIHIHVPEGATPKDGPSAGITIATSLVSALTGYAVRPDVAMTGEITLRGRVLPIGGLKEKALAAFRSGIRRVIIPLENKKDLDEIPANIRVQMEFILCDNMDKVLEFALTNKKYSSPFTIAHKSAIPTGIGHVIDNHMQDLPVQEHKEL